MSTNTATITTGQRVACDHCGLKARLRQDGTYGKHGWRRSGVFTLCKKAFKPYAFHTGTFRVIERDAYGLGTKWLVSCRCGESWTGADYDEATRPWAAHAAHAVDLKEKQ